MKKIKLNNITTFILTLSLIGIISGFSYYKLSKDEITSNIDIKESINQRPKIINNLTKPISILIFSILLITSIINVVEVFYKSFTTGYLIAFLLSINLKTSIYYNLIYQIIPLLLELLLIITSIKISKNIITKLILNKGRIKILIKKYFLLSSFYYIYIILTYIFSLTINSKIFQNML